MLARAERVTRTREIREVLRDYMTRTHNRDNETVRTIPRELLEAQRQLDLLIKLETPAGSPQACVYCGDEKSEKMPAQRRDGVMCADYRSCNERSIGQQPHEPGNLTAGR